MNKIRPFAPSFSALPEILPIFPLTGVLLLPGGQLPLNIFEPRYLAMVNRAMAEDRLIGMVQPKQKDQTNPPVYNIGCAGKIVDFSETSDGRYLITLAGICRFKIHEELDLARRGFRQIKPDWAPYEDDLYENKKINIDRPALKELLHRYFEMQGMQCDWEAVDEAPDSKLITCLSMICPFDAPEKQALLEAECGSKRAELFMAMMDMAIKSGKEDKASGAAH